MFKKNREADFFAAKNLNKNFISLVYLLKKLQTSINFNLFAIDEDDIDVRLHIAFLSCADIELLIISHQEIFYRDI